MNSIDPGLAVTQALQSPSVTLRQAQGEPDADRARVKDLAEQFESMLMSQMLKELRGGMFGDDDQEQGLGAGAFNDSMNSQLGLALSRSGGIGIADILKKAIDRQNGLDRQDGQDGKITPEHPLLQAIKPADTGTITSDYGWRSDPFTGQAQFHAGRDIRMAYGQDVHAAGAGVVSFAGERSGYGLTVEVDHGDGKVTRYAHLSAADVVQGQLVDAGQVIANAGNSGRSTGTHLHFEVLDHGHPVDPGTPIQGFQGVADSQQGRVLRSMTQG